MPRIVPVEHEQTQGEARLVFDEGLAKYGRMTNMKRTLMHSLPAYHALMEWYPLFDAIKAFVGERSAVIFAHAISSQSDCLICTTFMRRLLINAGEDPGHLKLDDKEQVLVDFGRAIVGPGNRAPADIYARLAGLFDARQIVELTAFASLMVATNLINNALEVDLDEYLYDFRAGNPLPKKG